MKIYNTMTRKKEEFKPINPPNVTMYVCGPTVYDYFHIGNGRSFIMADMIRKYLEYKGYNVQFAMNLTDVDDKIIKKANEQKVEAKNVAEEYSNAFFEDIAKLKIKKATIYPKATEHMGDIIDLIKNIEDKGTAYNVEGNVFFNVNEFKGYGKLSGKNTDDLEVGARVEINKDKKNPLDFSLWKKAKDGEPYWESPWGNGRPGWHIECSAMSMKHLGQTIDIHAGGNDLIFPHHENEIAQSEAAHDHDFVNYWIHFGFLNFQNEKMSKSLGNFFTVRDILKKYSAEAIRMFFSQTHYARPLNFGDDFLAAAAKGVEKLHNLGKVILKGIAGAEEGVEHSFDFKKYYTLFEEAMDDDFNTPQATAVFYDFTKEMNSYMAENQDPGKTFYEEAKTFLEKTAQDILGVIFFDELSVEEQGASIEQDLVNLLIDLRAEAKNNKNYALADEIRNRLKEIGIILQDSKQGTTYKRA